MSSLTAILWAWYGYASWHNYILRLSPTLFLCFLYVSLADSRLFGCLIRYAFNKSIGKQQIEREVKPVLVGITELSDYEQMWTRRISVTNIKLCAI